MAQLPLSPAAPAVAGVPRQILRAEGMVLLAASLAAYAHLGGSWLWFAVLLLAPDLTMIAYLAGPRIGAIAYNAVHSTVAAFALAALGLAAGLDGAVLGAIIVAAHIGMDRMLGYGLKYGTAFGDTHLGSMGRRT